MQQAEQLYVAIDGGGSKTDVVLLHRSGRVLNRIIGEASNVNDIGMAILEERLSNLLDNLLVDYGGREARLKRVYAGMSGGGLKENRKQLHALLHKLLPGTEEVRNEGDGLNALAAGLGYRDGMVMIAGTGSIVYIKSEGEIHQVGGWGYMLGDEGSGYYIGAAVLKEALRTIDGRSSSPLIVQLVEDRLGGGLINSIPFIYEKGKAYIAKFAPIAFQAAGQGDSAASAILDEAADELARMAKAGCAKLRREDWNIILAGGIWESGAALVQRLRDRLDDEVILQPLDMPPVYGASLLALQGTEQEYDIESGAFKVHFREKMHEGIGGLVN